MSLMASFAFYSTTSYEKLLFDNIIEKQSEKLTLYRGGGISDEEMKIYERFTQLIALYLRKIVIWRCII